MKIMILGRLAGSMISPLTWAESGYLKCGFGQSSLEGTFDGVEWNIQRIDGETESCLRKATL